MPEHRQQKRRQPARWEWLLPMTPIALAVLDAFLRWFGK